MQEFFEQFAHYGYLILFIYSLGGGMLALAALGVFSASSDQINPIIACSLASIANFLGSWLFYYVCKNYKQEFDKYLQTHKRKIALLVIWFRKNGFLITLLCKFLYGFKTISPIAAQLAKLSRLKFLIYNAISCVIWSVVVFSVAKLASEFIKRLSEHFNTLYLAAGFLVVLALVWLIISKKSSKNA